MSRIALRTADTDSSPATFARPTCEVLAGGASGTGAGPTQRDLLGRTVGEVDHPHASGERRVRERRSPRDHARVPHDDGLKGLERPGAREGAHENLGADPRRVTHDNREAGPHGYGFFQTASISVRNFVLSASERFCATPSS